MSRTEKLEIHLRDGGGVMFVTVEEGDDGVEDIEALDPFIERVLAGQPRWVWIGEAYVFNRAIAAIRYGDDLTLDAPLTGGSFGLSLPEAA